MTIKTKNTLKTLIYWKGEDNYGYAPIHLDIEQIVAKYVGMEMAEEIAEDVFEYLVNNECLKEE